MRFVRHLHRTCGCTARSAVVVLGGAGLLLAGSLAVPAAASGAGTAPLGTAPVSTRAAAAATATSTTAPRTSTSTSGGKVTCSWAPAYASSVLATTIYFHVTDMSNCLSPGPSSATITVYATWADAQARTNGVGSTTAMWGLDGAVTGLTPDTDYWWVSTDNPGSVRGPVHTLKALTTSPTTTTGGPVCTPAPSMPLSATATSISFLRRTSATCPSTEPLTITVYARRADAEARKRPVGTVSGLPGVVLTVDGLKPNRKYWYVSSDANYARGPVSTLRVKSSTSSAPPSCTATYRVVNA